MTIRVRGGAAIEKHILAPRAIKLGQSVRSYRLLWA